MRFRILILKDPDAKARGFDLRGTKVPLTFFCPVRAKPDIATFNGQRSLDQIETEYWKVPICLLFKARPDLIPIKTLRQADNFLIPVSWCDIAPIGPADADYYHRFD